MQAGFTGCMKQKRKCWFTTTLMFGLGCWKRCIIGHLPDMYQSAIHQKVAVIDQKTTWYGSINRLSYGNAEESIMRIESSNIANELIRSID